MAQATTEIDSERGGGSGARRLQLAILEGRELRVVQLDSLRVFVIGRSEGAHVRIEDARVSREHACLHIDDSIAIEDLDSANGTVVENRKLEPRVRVPILPGQAISVGNTICIVQVAPTEVTIGQQTIPPSMLKPAVPESLPPGMVVIDEHMQHLIQLAARVAGAQIELNVLLLGETGTGKELLAETIHRCSRRVHGPFVRLNCAAFTESLLESELFGYERGAFTGASRSTSGLLESASGGTVFLDELGEMLPATQAKLLRVLETREVRRVGAARSRAIDVRFVSATNRDLADEVVRGRFRRDLYYRLNAVTLNVPPLRERQSELRALAERFIAEACASNDASSAVPQLSAEALALLSRYAWPGNIRELRNTIRRALILSDSARTLRPEHLVLDTGNTCSTREGEGGPEGAGVQQQSQVEVPGTSPREHTTGQDELEAIGDALTRFAGNQTRAAEYLGIPLRTFVRRLQRYGLSRPRTPG